MHLYSIPGYIEDGRSWPAIWSGVKNILTPLDWILLSVGVPCFMYAFQVHTWPKRLLNFRFQKPKEIRETGTSTQEIADPPDEGGRTLTRVCLLLSEAATGIVDAQPSIDVDDRRASVLFGAYYFDVLRFLEMAFVVNHADDMRHYVQSRRDDSMGNAEMMASFLKNLEKRIKSDELDPGFVLPMTFDEFVNHHENWPRNTNRG